MSLAAVQGSKVASDLFLKAQGVSLEHWRQQARHFNLGGRRIAWWERGSGEPLFLIHGFPTAAWDWQYLWQALASDYRVIALDLLGYGFSEKPWPHRYSIAEQADIVQALSRALNLKQIHLLTHDYGDTVAQELLVRHNQGPAFIASLCLLNGGLFPEVHRPVLSQKLLLSPLGFLLTRLFNQRTLARNFKRIFGRDTPPSPAEIAGFWQLIEHHQGRRVIPGLVQYMEERRRFRERWVGALVNTQVPVRLINGVDDPISGGHMADRFEELVPKPDVVRLPGIGHYPQIEAPAAVLKAYGEFRAALSQPSSQSKKNSGRRAFKSP